MGEESGPVSSAFGTSVSASDCASADGNCPWERVCTEAVSILSEATLEAGAETGVFWGPSIPFPLSKLWSVSSLL